MTSSDRRSSWLIRQLILIGLAVVAAIQLAACSTVRALERVPGADISLVKVGATRSQVETALGDPQREWVTRTGVRYCLYRYEADIEPSPSLAAGTVLVNIATLGLYEAMVAAGPPFYNDPRRHELVLIAVAYDAGDIVLGVFDDVGEFTALPEDGRPTAEPEPGVPSTTR